MLDTNTFITPILEPGWTPETSSSETKSPNLTSITNSEAHDESSKQARLEQAISRRAQECASLEAEIKKQKGFISICMDTLVHAANDEMTAIDAQIAALVQKREEASVRHLKDKDEMGALGESILSPLTTSLHHLERLNLLQRSLTAPITKLPVELLGYIFDAYVELEETPWRLVLVSPTWRKIALSTSRLWRYILVTGDIHIVEKYWSIGGDIGDVTSFGRYTICFNEAELVQVLNLSGSTSLSISLRLRGNAFGSTMDYTPLVHLFGEPTSSRVGELDIQFGGFGGCEPSSLLTYISASYPRLKSLTYSNTGSNWDTSFMAKLLESSQLSELCFKSPIPVDVSTSPGWTSVRHLTLPAGLDPSLLNKFCSKLQNIQTLQYPPLNWPNESTPHTNFKFLQELELRCETRHLHRLHLPSLTKLNVTGRPFTQAAPHRSWTLPSLSEFRGELSTIVIADFLPSIVSPKLKTLTLVASDYMYPQVFPEISYPTLKSIHLEGHVAAKYLLGALAAAPNAQKVVIKPGKPHAEYLRDALACLSDVSVENMLCPNASDIQFGTQQSPLFLPKRGFSSLFKRCVASRKNARNQPITISVFTSPRRSFQVSTLSYS
ncbi:hypothetical protein FRC17_006753 [Serendipita sp. 399]|nr:hypothetical protein FRC17_006753 [Serendipita sp. 399]